MAVPGSLIAALVGAGGGALALVLARRASASPGKPTCQALADFGLPPEACELVPGGGKVVDAVVKTGTSIAGAIASIGGSDGPTEDEADAKNRSLNGDIELPLTDEARAMSYVHRSPVNERDELMLADRPPRPALLGSALRYKNGCVPFEGAPGWEHCEAGTHSMWAADEGWAFLTALDGSYDTFQAQRDWALERQKLLTGNVDAASAEPIIGPNRDPVTGAIPPSTKITRTLAGGALNLTFAPSVAPKQAYLYKGRPFACPPEAPPQWHLAGTDHRDGHENDPPPCGVPTSSPPPVYPPEGSTVTSSSYAPGDPSNPANWPYGYRWVPATVTSPGYFARVSSTYYVTPSLWPTGYRWVSTGTASGRWERTT